MNAFVVWLLSSAMCLLPLGYCARAALLDFRKRSSFGTPGVLRGRRS